MKLNNTIQPANNTNPRVISDCENHEINSQALEQSIESRKCHPFIPPISEKYLTANNTTYSSIFFLNSPLELEKSPIISESHEKTLNQPEKTVGKSILSTTASALNARRNLMNSSELSQQLNDTPNKAQHIIFEYPESLKPYRPTLNSWFASLFAVAFGFPLDSVKTRLQTYKYNGNWHCIVDTYKNEGILGFYRGMLIVQ